MTSSIEDQLELWGLPPVKIMNGKKYVLKFTPTHELGPKHRGEFLWKTRKDALQAAKKLREQGHMARVIHFPEQLGYAVYFVPAYRR
ncbi:MAG: hypothetical protein WC489_06185 [Patescibacteria group bacterium]|jgi:hypothetical protein